MTKRRTARILGVAAGAVALGAAAGLAAERQLAGRARRVEDPTHDVEFFTAASDREIDVIADDGVPLHVEEVGPEDAALTVVFCHGYALQLAMWHFQRSDLAQENPGRLLFWDQRSHGRSGRSTHARSTIDQLGHDLHRVLQERVPTGKVILVGHSMGGMSIMALAQHYPELFGTRVVGVALIATSPGLFGEIRIGVPAVLAGTSRRLSPLVTAGLRARPGLFEGGRRVTADLAFLATRRGGFGGSATPPSLVEFVDRMIGETPVDVLAEFFNTFSVHDKIEALRGMSEVETLVLVGSKDRVTPVAHSRGMVSALPKSQLVVLEGAGHMVMLERPELVTLHLRALIKRASRASRRTA